MGCTNYDVTITQEDLNLSEDGKVYIYYYPCDVLDQTITSFSYSGTYENALCIDNCLGTPTICINWDGITCYTGITSTLTSTGQACQIDPPECPKCSGVTIQQEGYVNLTDFVDIGQSYGNLEVTITTTGASYITQIFVGNADENIGELFNFGKSPATITKTVGFYSSASKTTVDVLVYSQQTYTMEWIDYSFDICISCPTVAPCDAPTPTPTPTITQTPSNTPTQTQTSSETPTQTQTNTPTTTEGLTPTTTPTNTKTPTTTPTQNCAILTVLSADTVLDNACAGPATYSISTGFYVGGNPCSLCNCTSITGPGVFDIPLGLIYISDGVNVRQFNKTSTGITINAVGVGDCISCAAP